MRLPCLQATLHAFCSFPLLLCPLNPCFLYSVQVVWGTQMELDRCFPKASLGVPSSPGSPHPLSRPGLEGGRPTNRTLSSPGALVLCRVLFSPPSESFFSLTVFFFSPPPGRKKKEKKEKEKAALPASCFCSFYFFFCRQEEKIKKPKSPPLPAVPLALPLPPVLPGLPLGAPSLALCLSL